MKMLIPHFFILCVFEIIKYVDEKIYNYWIYSSQGKTYFQFRLLILTSFIGEFVHPVGEEDML